jgi:hypothetical protein
MESWQQPEPPTPPGAHPPPPPPPRTARRASQWRFHCRGIVVPLAVLATVWVAIRLRDTGGWAGLLDWLHVTHVSDRTSFSGLVVLATLLVGIVVIVRILLFKNARET